MTATGGSWPLGLRLSTPTGRPSTVTARSSATCRGSSLILEVRRDQPAGRGRVLLIPLGLLLAAGCSSAPAQTPTQTAASLLTQAGAKASDSAYMVGFDTSNSECPTGAGEADGMIAADGGQYANVCVFPSNADLVAYVSAGNQYGAGAALIQVGSGSLVIVEPVGAGGSLLLPWCRLSRARPEDRLPLVTARGLPVKPLAIIPAAA